MPQLGLLRIGYGSYIASYIGRPLYECFKDLDGFYDFHEVINSPWPVELSRQNQKVLPDSSYSHRHFIVFFLDSTFGCLAQDFKVFNYEEGTSVVLAKLTEKMASE